MVFRFYPSKIASKAITATIKQQFSEPWLTWGAIPKADRDIFFQRFKVLVFIPLKNAYNLQFGLMIVVLQRKVTWRVEDEDKVNKNFIRRLLTVFHKCLKWLAKKENNQNGLGIMFGTTSWNSGTCLCIDPNAIQLKKIVCLKKVDVCTPEDPLACMNMLFVWYDFHIKFCTNLWLIITSLIYKMFSL